MFLESHQNVLHGEVAVNINYYCLGGVKITQRLIYFRVAMLSIDVIHQRAGVVAHRRAASARLTLEAELFVL